MGVPVVAPQGIAGFYGVQAYPGLQGVRGIHGVQGIQGVMGGMLPVSTLGLNPYASLYGRGRYGHMYPYMTQNTVTMLPVTTVAQTVPTGVNAVNAVNAVNSVNAVNAVAPKFSVLPRGKRGKYTRVAASDGKSAIMSAGPRKHFTASNTGAPLRTFTKEPAQPKATSILTTSPEEKQTRETPENAHKISENGHTYINPFLP
eukprot:GHVR01043185.1.p1 GENE.GHVR01043185.1~~GHVR01043185.1.p1  ORF type:complete len:202 (+),score=7.72 GHVR01043185.1:244-849(+)